ncbi:hypothetical protein DSO57_1009125 [Entomophthora muscae]|uniref:Uncharacterized protein n=1 Tax=Entomophthora muscae TaxID=34485 RepID=A0ACC2TV17_9FUNG|nr:hypothetical protein DSO57_1009125 [Entomophthora muscae]
MHPVVGLLLCIPYNLIISQIITGRWGPAVGTLLLAPPNVNSMPANLGVVPPVFETENLVLSQCPEFYAEGTLIFSQAIYLRLFWLGISFENFTKQYLKLHWWLTINSMWIWMVIPHHLDTASYDLLISVTSVAVNSLPSLALDHIIFPQRTKKSNQSPAKPLNSMAELDNTFDKKFVLSYPSQAPPTSSSSPWLTVEESLINLDCYLTWCCPPFQDY